MVVPGVVYFGRRLDKVDMPIQCVFPSLVDSRWLIDYVSTNRGSLVDASYPGAGVRG